MRGPQRVGGLWDVVAQPADHGDVLTVADQGRLGEGRPAEVGRDAVRAGEVAFHGGGEAGHDDRHVPGPVDVSHRDSDPRAAAGDVERQELPRRTVVLLEDLAGGPHRSQLGDCLVVGDTATATPEGADGHRAEQSRIAVHDIAPGLRPGLDVGRLSGQLRLRPVEQDPVRAVAGPPGEPIGGSDDLRMLPDRGLLSRC